MRPDNELFFSPSFFPVDDAFRVFWVVKTHCPQKSSNSHVACYYGYYRAHSPTLAGLVIRWSWPTTLVSTSAITAAFWRCDWFKKFWLRRLLRYWEYDWFHWRVNDPTGKTQRDKVLGMVDGLVYILYRRWAKKRKGVSSVEENVFSNGSSLTLT